MDCSDTQLMGKLILKCASVLYHNSQTLASQSGAHMSLERAHTFVGL